MMPDGIPLKSTMPQVAGKAATKDDMRFFRH